MHMLARRVQDGAATEQVLKPGPTHPDPGGYPSPHLMTCVSLGQGPRGA
jgi:hypothetical protein